MNGHARASLMQIGVRSTGSIARKSSDRAFAEQGDPVVGHPADVQGM